MKKFVKYGSLLLLFLMVLSVSKMTVAAASGDPTGASYVLTTGSETLNDVALTANKAYFGSNFVWIMITGFMVFFFQCGFAMVETGFCRGKNAAHVMTMNFMVFLVGAIGYFLTGFALQYGGSGGAAGDFNLAHFGHGAGGWRNHVGANGNWQYAAACQIIVHANFHLA